jgi:3-phosphoshikimate 1-carboxyvinyltransferase
MTTVYEILPVGPVSGRLAAPPSKSVTNRLLVLAALADGVSTLRHPLRSDDTAAMVDAVSAFGAVVKEVSDGWRVTGTGGRLTSPGEPVDARQSGTVLRFVTVLATLAPEGGALTGAPSLLRRPLTPLVQSLAALDAAVEEERGASLVRVKGGGLAGGQVSVDVTASSQFASAVLLAALHLGSASTLRVYHS